MAFEISFSNILKVQPQTSFCMWLFWFKFGLSDDTGLETQFGQPNERGALGGDCGTWTALQIFLNCWYETGFMSASASWPFSLHAQNKFACKDTTAHFTQESSAPKVRSLASSLCAFGHPNKDGNLVLNSPARSASRGGNSQNPGTKSVGFLRGWE